MDEFKPEDELKPDTSDRRPTRPRKTSSAPKVPVSRQHMMMAIGILVLILLVVGIGSALKSPDSSSASGGSKPASGSAEKSIDLSGSSSMSGASSAPAAAEGQQAGNAQSGAPQELSAPQIAANPTEAQSLPVPQNQQRVELPGDLNNALSNQQGQVDAAAQSGIGDSTLPVAPATVVAGAGSRALAGKPLAGSPVAAQQNHRSAAAHKPAASKPLHNESKPQATTRNASANNTAAVASSRSSSSAAAATPPASRSQPAASGSTPGGNFTLQLSSASRSDTLNAWARKQNLSGYHVYQTTRNGQPWYVLVSGSYATSADAKRAVATLPADVRAQNPWVKPVSQVKKEAGK